VRLQLGRLELWLGAHGAAAAQAEHALRCCEVGALGGRRRAPRLRGGGGGGGPTATAMAAAMATAQQAGPTALPLVIGAQARALMARAALKRSLCVRAKEGGDGEDGDCAAALAHSEEAASAPDHGRRLVAAAADAAIELVCCRRCCCACCCCDCCCCGGGGGGGGGGVPFPRGRRGAHAPPWPPSS
jgi:hypothetical protein